MKDNKNEEKYLDGHNNSDDNKNDVLSKSNIKNDSLDKYFKSFEDNHESNDILKELENLNLSEEKSFEMPQKIFEPLSEKSQENKKTINNDKAIEKDINKIVHNKEIYNSNAKENYSKYDLMNEFKRENNDNENNNIIDNNNQCADEIFSNGEESEKLSEFLLKEKLNRICTSIQGYTLNQKCYHYLNNFIPFLSKLPQNLYHPIDNLFDVYIELLMRIKQEFNIKENLIHKLNNVSLNNEGYEKKLLKLKKEINEKEKEIGSLINKVNCEKDKTNNNSKMKLLEINSLKKENQQLNNKISLYKNQIRKTEADYKAIQNKLKYYIFERENKTNNLSSNINEKNNLNNNQEKNNQEEFKINNDKYLAIKKLNMSLVYLLKDINKNICKYDFGLNKIINIENKSNNNYEIEDLNDNIETNILINENNCKNLYKNFMFNMDIINNKIIDILKQKNEKKEGNYSKIYNSKKINNCNNDFKKSNNQENDYKNDKSLINNNYKSNPNEDKFTNDKFINNNKIQNNYKNNFNNNKNNNKLKSQGFNFNKLGINNNNVNTKYEYHTQNPVVNEDTNININNRKKKSMNFLNFYNDDKDLEDNIETKTAINPKWYENCKNKKVEYIFDENKIFNCIDEEDRTNGANRK